MRTIALALLLLGGLPQLVASHDDTAQTGTIYVCPMHPDVTSRTPGTCSKCGMALVPADPASRAEYVVQIETVPGEVQAGTPTEFRLRVLHPTSRRPVNRLAVVHDKRYHLFIVSQDLEHFAHLHPTENRDGSWTVTHTLPKPGHYRVYSDFKPVGGPAQVIANTVTTTGYDHPLAESMPQLTPDPTMEKSADGFTVRLSAEPATLVAGREARLRYELSANGAPVTDLEPYLGAWGHALVLSEDAQEYVHAHPIEPVSTSARAPRAGPIVTFEATFPKPGRYRIWTQFKRRGTVSTTVYTLEVLPAPSEP